MAAKKILFVSQEIAPYLPANEISTLGKTLPQSLQGKRFEVRTFMPKFGNVNERRNQLHEVIRLSGLNIEINNNDHPRILKVASNRTDNDERALYFARGTMETVKKLKWDPEIIQCSGWITALTPLYIRTIFNPDDPDAPTPKIIYCVEPSNPDMAPIDPELIRKLREDGIPDEYVSKYEAGQMDVNTLHRIGIDNSQAVIFLTDTPDQELLKYAQERGLPVMTKEEVEKKGLAGFPEFYDSI